MCIAAAEDVLQVYFVLSGMNRYSTAMFIVRVREYFAL
jgi:hypothetical protein